MEKEVELRRSKKLMGDEGGISEVESGSVSGPRSKSIDEDQPLSKKKTIKSSSSKSNSDAHPSISAATTTTTTTITTTPPPVIPLDI
ncbi:hypothetical protein ACHAO8_011599 [Botrytis cinerea]